MKTRKIFLLITLFILLAGIVSATDASGNSTSSNLVEDSVASHNIYDDVDNEKEYSHNKIDYCTRDVESTISTKSNGGICDESSFEINETKIKPTANTFIPIEKEHMTMIKMGKNLLV